MLVVDVCDVVYILILLDSYVVLVKKCFEVGVYCLVEKFVVLSVVEM